MERLKLVVHFADGRILRGYTANFDPTAPQFILTPADGRPGAKPQTVEIKALKAIFFVRDIAGRPGYQEKKVFENTQPYQGRRVRVQFRDGERVVGSTPHYAPTLPGFFVFPADPQSNTIKLFAVAASVADVTWL